ncbi:hypothetical protein Y1Q_0015203 [Alligator mississippiensis]|uniref:Uncharacterized protein n=1 Tax=Alligator mississippiensis TaxID=8496 RepID=A0A151P956_ALLMI|nr:hypothetical protein Y1Q_0015203 [Alligator mississippiensis]
MGCAMFMLLPEGQDHFICNKYKLVSALEEKIHSLEAGARFPRHSCASAQETGSIAATIYRLRLLSPSREITNQV